MEMAPSLVKLIVGLGNPGNQYAETRHNIGWMVLDRLADRAGRTGRGRQRDASATMELRFKGLDLLLAKPQTYMNDSGIAVRKLLARDRVPLVDLLVVADDFALPFGKLRFREGGSHGGHNGLRSIIDELGTEKVARLRVGIGEPGRGAIDHVLSTFQADERDLPADPPRRRGRRRRGVGARRHLEGREPLQQLRPPVRAAGRGRGDRSRASRAVRPTSTGIRRTKTGWRRILGGDDARATRRRRGGAPT